MENSAQNGLAYLDPYRPAELAQNAGEQLTGGVARHIVLEMEPDELGKISIKVGAKKGEISVEALTQSEPARQALMRHSPGLRQDLQDQGLVLEKFMVDVNREQIRWRKSPGAILKEKPRRFPKRQNRQHSGHSGISPISGTRTANRESAFLHELTGSGGLCGSKQEDQTFARTPKIRLADLQVLSKKREPLKWLP